MQKGVQKTEEMLVKVKQYFSGSPISMCTIPCTIHLDNFDREAQSLVLEKWFRAQWASGNVA